MALFTSLSLRDGVLKGECYERPTGVIRVTDWSYSLEQLQSVERTTPVGLLQELG